MDFWLMDSDFCDRCFKELNYGEVGLCGECWEEYFAEEEAIEEELEAGEISPLALPRYQQSNDSPNC